MTKICTTPKTGPFAGQRVFTNHEGEGIFTHSNGHSPALIQHVGTSQTPTFRSARQLAAWVRRYFDYSQREG